MLKKKLLTGIIAVMILSISACGSSKEQKTTKTQNAKTENIQRETVSDKEVRNETIPEDVSDEMNKYEICMTYFNFRSGLETEEDTIDHLQILGVTLDEAEVIFEQYGGDFMEELAQIEADAPTDIPYFDATEEIKNASMQQFKFQVADIVFSSFSTLTDCIEQIENSTLSFTCEYNPDKLMPIQDKAHIEVYLNNELYMTLEVGNPRRTSDDETTRTLKEGIVYNIILNDYSNVYYAGGIPAINAGISVAEFDELMQKDLNSMIEDKTMSRIDNIYGDPNHYYLYYQFTTPLNRIVLECDNAAQNCCNYKYKAMFNESGTELESFMLVYDPINGRDFEMYGNTDSVTVLER